MVAHDENSKVIEQIDAWHNNWFTLHQWWIVTYWTLGVLSAACSSLAAAKDVSGIAAPWFSVTASICIAVLGFTNPQRRSSGYLAAWRTVGMALLRYRTGDGEIAKVLFAVEQGEAAIGGNGYKHEPDPKNKT